uniref:DUF4283 domain-containing protein n=1 Tax=Nelumbo nucifera TaxID=4432 RepID=A0A822XW43_NELNU|nr:TPA_asm: hypothetical protein HUJ06_025426 [Nelumbo nucifera]
MNEKVQQKISTEKAEMGENESVLVGKGEQITQKAVKEYIACSVKLSKLELNVDKQKWNNKFVLIARKKIKDWQLIAEEIMKNFSIKKLVLVVSFSENRAILDIGEVKIELSSFETQEGLIVIEEWRMSCNERDITVACFNIKLLGVPFNFWNKSIVDKIVHTVGGSMEDYGFSDLMEIKVRIRGIKPEEVPRLVTFFSEGLWRKIWVLTELEASLWRSCSKEEEEGDMEEGSVRGRLLVGGEGKEHGELFGEEEESSSKGVLGGHIERGNNSKIFKAKSQVVGPSYADVVKILGGLTFKPGGISSDPCGSGQRAGKEAGQVDL